MAESWATLASYRLHDLLMFSADTYFRLFELVNRQWWPVALAGALLPLAVLVATLRSQVPRAAVALLAPAWVSVALLYLADGLAGIHWLGPWWAGAFLLQAAAWLAWLAAVRPACAARGPRRVAGLLLVGAATAWPALSWALQRPLWQAEVVGLAPDPTVLLSLGLLLTLQPTRRGALLLGLPLAWCLFSGATLWALAQPHALVLPLAGAAAALACGVPRR
jgi:hypothetical protein